MQASRMHRLRHAALALALGAALPLAHAGLFDDDEARRAILDIRQRLDQAAEQGKSREEAIKQLRGSILELNNQNEQLRKELAQLRGQNEQLARDVSELQRAQKDLKQGVDERVRKFEPQKVTIDGKEFSVEPEERRQYEDAVALVRKGDYAAASAALLAFNQRYPASGYKESALFWIGNARYANREYKEAIWAFRALVTQSPTHPRAPEALLSIANCQAELKDAKSARRTLDELIKAYPQSEAAVTGKERLATLR